ncbi:MAG TPA: hypothetical protein VJB70_01530 [Candidatus Paceibacterota bacterium]
MITYDDFSKLDIRIGTIVSAEKVEGADKLLRLEVEIGEEKPRQLVAGIAQHIADISTLIGKQIPMLANLEPRMLRGVESQGMILAASDEQGIVLLHPARPLTPGSKLK